jgi:D-alanyl-D-alanine dipeptidase
VPDTNYVASPRKASKHNYGCAVDVSLAELTTGRELDMPTGFDDFTEKAWLNYSNLPAEVLRNREILVTVMKKYGFIPYEAEWWHYTFRGWKQFGILDVSFKDLRDFSKQPW